VGAYREVADAVTSRRKLEDRMTNAEASLAAADAAYKIAQLRYKGGLSTYQDTLAVEDRLLITRRAVAQLRSRGFTLDLQLVRALGGGFDAAAMLQDAANSSSRDTTHG
jgi:outer membrane protein TolC